MPKTVKREDALDVAARYFVYKLYAATVEQQLRWLVLFGLGEKATTVVHAVKRGWVVLQDDKVGNPLKRSAALTDEGRRVVRKGRTGLGGAPLTFPDVTIQGPEAHQGNA